MLEFFKFLVKERGAQLYLYAIKVFICGKKVDDQR
jgi:hypothetical protein